jgi:glycosyltransferase involved in cell wall biosynthesis
MSPPDVTVIIPCRNYGRFLADALESALSTLTLNVEILLFNDESTDDTDRVARRYAEDERIRYVRQRQRGLAGTRNIGLRRARGRYVQFLDADDILHPEKLVRQVRLLDDDMTIAATYAPHITVDAAGRRIDEPVPWRPLSTDDPLHDLLTNWDRTLHLPPLGFLFRRAHLDGLTFDESLPTHEEWDFYLRLLARGARLQPSAEPLAFYRRHAGSLSTDLRKMTAGRRMVLEKVAGWGGVVGDIAVACLASDRGSGPNLH